LSYGRRTCAIACGIPVHDADVGEDVGHRESRWDQVVLGRSGCGAKDLNFGPGTWFYPGPLRRTRVRPVVESAGPVPRT